MHSSLHKKCNLNFHSKSRPSGGKSSPYCKSFFMQKIHQWSLFTAERKTTKYVQHFDICGKGRFLTNFETSVHENSKRWRVIDVVDVHPPRGFPRPWVDVIKAPKHLATLFWRHYIFIKFINNQNAFLHLLLYTHLQNNNLMLVTN